MGRGSRITVALVALLGLTALQQAFVSAGPMGQPTRRAVATRTRCMAVGSGPISQEDLEFLETSGVDMTEVQADSSVGDFFEALLPKTGVTPDFLGKIFLFGLLVTLISAGSTSLYWARKSILTCQAVQARGAWRTWARSAMRRLARAWIPWPIWASRGRRSFLAAKSLERRRKVAFRQVSALALLLWYVAAIANATEIRQQEKSMNAATIQEAQKAQAAVLEAINALKELGDLGRIIGIRWFYESSGLALVQSGSKQPAMTSPYGGMTSETGGVVSLLETISADFARLEADTKSEEIRKSRDHGDARCSTAQFSPDAETDLKHLQSTKVEKTSQLATKGAELQTGEQELAAALQYYEELKPPCVKGGEAWKDTGSLEREEQRQEELESLKKAMDIISQWALPDLSCQLQIPVGTAGPQRRAPELSGQRRTSTASSRAQCATPDLNCELQIPVGNAGPQRRAPDPSGQRRTSTARSRSQCAVPDLNREI
eukprot:s18_g22.t1